VLVVPDLRRQAFVFAKGALQDAGFAWQVVGGVRGFAANVVVGQSPAAGTRLFDTGAPAVKLTLSHNSKYPQSGSPEDLSPYRATSVELADAAAAPLAPARATTTPAPATTTPAPAAAGTTTTATKPAAKPAAKPKAAPKARYPQTRPVAFTVAGAAKEPLDEMPLTDRAAQLGRWLEAHPKPTDASVRHWLYQNEWVVTGAKFGWWRGADALRKLIVVDRRAEALWGIGNKSEAAAARALAEVEAKSK
jgi:cell division septation protein DedD